jgi:hypothetical protein
MKMNKTMEEIMWSITTETNQSGSTVVYSGKRNLSALKKLSDAGLITYTAIEHGLLIVKKAGV